ncbi:MBL fold metallo-hydrolase [Streptococcus parauberis]|uniref:MBL fold metallo-hydrolase n=1 Tax=Streptococcus parauberis TaxID=1348 RepID=UPI0035D73A31
MFNLLYLFSYVFRGALNKIDQLLLTHTDTDHVGDMEDVVKSINIKEILVSQGSLTNQEFVDRLYKMKRKVKVIKRGDVLPVMGSQLRVLYPFKKGDGKNNDSIVLYGKLLNKRLMLSLNLRVTIV